MGTKHEVSFNLLLLRPDKKLTTQTNKTPLGKGGLSPMIAQRKVSLTSSPFKNDLEEIQVMEENLIKLILNRLKFSCSLKIPPVSKLKSQDGTTKTLAVYLNGLFLHDQSSSSM